MYSRICCMSKYLSLQMTLPLPKLESVSSHLVQEALARQQRQRVLPAYASNVASVREQYGRVSRHYNYSGKRRTCQCIEALKLLRQRHHQIAHSRRAFFHQIAPSLRAFFIKLFFPEGFFHQIALGPGAGGRPGVCPGGSAPGGRCKTLICFIHSVGFLVQAFSSSHPRPSPPCRVVRAPTA